MNPADGKKEIDGKDTSDFPVENVSYEEATEFCQTLSAMAKEKDAKRVYRLPTEAEWEYACRGGAATARVFHFGDDLSSKQANFDGRSPYGDAGKGNCLGRTEKVGQYPANKFGLFDMHGNVWEWCADGYDAGAYLAERYPRLDPVGPPKDPGWVIRGGGWWYDGAHCRSAKRFANAPNHRGGLVGFRVVLVPSGK